MATQPLGRAGSGGAAAGPGGAPPVSGSLIRWLWIWITLGILVVVTVIGFLIGIVRALESIDRGLARAENSVVGIGGDAKPLPAAVGTINTSLGNIDTALKPIRFQAVEISDGLNLITSSLQQIDASLKDTSGSLVDTSGSLVDTSGTLVTVSQQAGTISASVADTSNVLANVLNLAGSIQDTLESAQNAGSLGTNRIVGRVVVANQILGPAQADTNNINTQLVGVNQNLTNICTSIPLTVLGIVTQPRC